MGRSEVSLSSARVLTCLGPVVLTILLASSVAHSETAKTARQYAAEAEAEYNLGHFADSIPLYEKAYKLKPAPILLFNLGQCHRHLGNNERALFFYRRYLDAAPEAEDRPDVEKRVADLERAIAEQAALKNRPPPDVRPDPPASSATTPQAPPPESDAVVVKTAVAPSPPADGTPPPTATGGDSKRTLRVLAWGSGIAAAGALIFGGVEAVLWSKRVRAFDDHVGPSSIDPSRTSKNCGSDQPNHGGTGCASLYDDISSAKTLTIVGLTAGGLLAAGSVTLFILSRPPAGGAPIAQAAACSPDFLSPGLSCLFSF